MYYSTNQETFNHDSQDDVFDAMFCDEEFYVGAIYWQGEARSVKATDFCSADGYLESIREGAWEQCGDYAEAWLSRNISRAAEDELSNLINAWFDKHNPIDFLTIENVKEMRVTDVEFAEFMAMLWRPSVVQTVSE